MQRTRFVLTVFLVSFLSVITMFGLSAQNTLERYQPEAVGFYVFTRAQKNLAEGNHFSFLQKKPLPEPVWYQHPTTLPWSDECLPFFCRIEKKLAIRLARPVKFRLGSVEYVDWLEGKGGGDYWPYVK